MRIETPVGLITNDTDKYNLPETSSAVIFHDAGTIELVMPKASEDPISKVSATGMMASAVMAAVHREPQELLEKFVEGLAKFKAERGL